MPPDDTPAAAFTIRIVSPEPLYLAGPARLRAEAVDDRGMPIESVAWMELTLDGKAFPPDGKPPFEWEFDAGPDLTRHRIEIKAVARNGARAHLATLSRAHAFVEQVGVDLVLVPVVVLDVPDGAAGEGTGRPVSGLRQSDFVVLEDGRERPITSFSDEPLPASVVLALDTSLSMEGELWSARKALVEFAGSFTSGSSFSLLTFNDQVFLEQGFTHSVDDVAAAAAAVRAEGMRTALYEALRIGAMHLAGRPGPRVLVLFTDGRDTLHEADSGRLRTSLDQAQAADVAVFAVAYGRAEAATLASIAEETGGALVTARNAGQLREAFATLSRAIGSRYLLGYEPPDPKKPGYRSIDVRVSRSGARILARRGYVMKPNGR
ncbi:MAG TPA: VWA domain-containing protein [Candidatus Polarisedimenticolia bacterium]|nr:VWA domain-containing protein [Candidatus Polarisedimenticolia bacterium]